MTKWSNPSSFGPYNVPKPKSHSLKEQVNISYVKL